jgi:Ca-activated chloride channel homolog
MIRLAQPWWLVLAGTGVLAAALWSVRRLWQRYPFPLCIVRNARGGVAVGATVIAGFLAAAALLPLAVAAARPQEVLSREIEHAKGVDIVIALDVSGSMAALDFKPSDRLGVAKQVISDFLARRPEDRMGLVVFAGAAVTLCPLTLDHDVARMLLDRVALGALPDGTAIGMGLGTAVNRLRHSKARSKIIVLVTDGANNAGELDPMGAAELAHEQGIKVYTVLVGRGGEVPIPLRFQDPRTGQVVTQIRQVRVDVNPELLASIARQTGGAAFRARDSRALQRVFDEIDRMEKTKFSSVKLVRYRERFEPWAAVALALVLAGIVVESALGRSPW